MMPRAVSVFVVGTILGIIVGLILSTIILKALHN